MLASLSRSYFRGHYLDTQATSIVDPRVLDAMLPYEIYAHGNCHSKQHGFGAEAMAGVEKARSQIANLIHANPKDIIFTSGATESNNIAIKGTMSFLQSRKKNHVIVSQIEHKCVIESARALQRRGFDVTFLPVQKDWLVKPAGLESAIRPTTGLVSVVLVNSEIGVVQPVKKLGVDSPFMMHDVMEPVPVPGKRMRAAKQRKKRLVRG